MPKIMETYCWETRLFQQVLEPPVQMCRLSKSAQFVTEDDIPLLPCHTSFFTYLRLIFAVAYECVKDEPR